MRRRPLREDLKEAREGPMWLSGRQDVTVAFKQHEYDEWVQTLEVLYRGNFLLLKPSRPFLLFQRTPPALTRITTYTVLFTPQQEHFVTDVISGPFHTQLQKQSHKGLVTCLKSQC